MTPSSPSTVPPSPAPISSPERGQPDAVQELRIFLRDAANYPSPIPPGVTGKYWLYLDPLVLRRVSPDMFQRAKIQKTLVGDAGGRLAELAKKVKFDYFANLSTIVISLSNRENTLATVFVRDIRDIMWQWGFYWPQWRTDKEIIRPLGVSNIVLDYGGAISKFEPDAGLAWRGVYYPFLVCEVANNENSHHVMEKKRPYLLGSRGMIRFFVVITLERADSRPRKHLLAGGDALESSRVAKIPRMGEAGATGGGDGGGVEVQQDGRSLNLEFLQDELDWVPGQPKGNIIKASISVFTSKVKLSDTGTPTRVIETIAESLEVWPNIPTETLTLRWNDLSVKNVPEALRTAEVNVPYRSLSGHIATFVAEESNTPGVDRPQGEVDGENVGIELSTASSPDAVLGDGDDE